MRSRKYAKSEPIQGVSEDFPIFKNGDLVLVSYKEEEYFLIIKEKIEENHSELTAYSLHFGISNYRKEIAIINYFYFFAEDKITKIISIKER